MFIKYLNRIMLIIRILTLPLIIFMGLDYMQGWGVARTPAALIVIFVFLVIYFFGSLTQTMLRLRNQ
ncbi:MAG: hypothetical protein HY762_02210, partial [Planctomycetes bacterium]|nr:hypothetical protein [Planctomycetota bacterium]